MKRQSGSYVGTTCLLLRQSSSSGTKSDGKWTQSGLLFSLCLWPDPNTAAVAPQLTERALRKQAIRVEYHKTRNDICRLQKKEDQNCCSLNKDNGTQFPEFRILVLPLCKRFVIEFLSIEFLSSVIQFWRVIKGSSQQEIQEKAWCTPPKLILKLNNSQ